LKKAIVFLAACSLLGGCTVHRAPDTFSAAPSCLRVTPSGGASLHWSLRTDPSERSALDAWCEGVGPAVFLPAGDTEVPVADSIAIVNWNTHIGSGDLDGLIDDLRSGVLTGRPVNEFVLLLQESYRAGRDVPARIPSWAVAATNPPDPERPGRSDITAVARRHGLWLLYVPSMRSGRDAGEVPEDRGNAILSTLPLQSPAALELPWERQRRVAISASIELRAGDGRPTALRLVSAHLDNRSRLGRIARSFGLGRRRQAEALADFVNDGGPTAMGADLNTWLSGHLAEAAKVLRRTLPLPGVLPERSTATLPGPIPDQKLDYLLFALPSGWTAGYRVVADEYGSDHHPLLGWVRVNATP
jgi:endonuclease/exonuclease/phosphatase family metal-dependent hydrolase